MSSWTYLYYHTCIPLSMVIGKVLQIFFSTFYYCHIRKLYQNPFQKSLLFFWQILSIQTKPFGNMNPSSISPRGIDWILQRKTQNVMFNCTFVNAKLKRKIFSCFMSSLTQNFYYCFSAFPCRHCLTTFCMWFYSVTSKEIFQGYENFFEKIKKSRQRDTLSGKKQKGWT